MVTQVTEANSEASSSTSTTSAGRNPLVIALAVALVAALVGLGLLWRALDSANDEADRLDQARSEARTAASDALLAMSSYDYRSLDDDFAWIDEVGTDKFRKELTPAVATLKKTIAQLKSHADAEVMRAAAEVQSDSKATVLLFLDQMLSDDTGEVSRELARVEMEMVRKDGTWLVDTVTTFNPASAVAAQ
jgi:Mce-associated membrane protein